MASEELEYNPFFQALQTDYFSQLSEAQDKCYTICIPRHSSLGNTATFNKEFAGLHILKPSPYVQGEYYSTDGDDSKRFTIDNGIVKAISGFSQPWKVQIIGEELGYNKKFERYRMYVVEQPLDPNFQKSVKNDGKDSLSALLKPIENLKECYDFLFAFPEHKEAMSELDKGIYAFNTSYVVVVGYLDHAAKKLRSLSEICQKQILEKNTQITADRRLLEKLKLSLESYILNQVHEKIFKVVCSTCASDCAKVTQKCKTYHYIDGGCLRLDSKFCCPLPAAIDVLKGLDTCTCPQQKAMCLRKTVDTVLHELNAHHQGKDEGALLLGQHKETVTVTSDELISLLVIIIIRSHCEYLPGQLKFIDTFHWTEFTYSECNYSVVTFKASLRFILSDTFDQVMKPKITPVLLKR